MNNKNKEKSNKSTYIFTKETLGMTLLLFSAIVLIMLLTGRSVFAGIGGAICTFLYGTFGYGSYLIIALLAYLGEWLVFEKKIKISFKPALAISLLIFSAFLLFHAATTRNFDMSSYGGYISQCYANAQKGFSGYTFGGVVSALLVYPFAKLTTFTGAYIFFSIFTIASGYFLFTVLRRKRTSSVQYVELSDKNSEDTEENQVAEVDVRQVSANTENVREYVVNQRQTKSAEVGNYEDADPYSKKNLGRKILFEKGEFDAESYRRNMIFNDNSYFSHPVRSDNDYLNSFSSNKSIPSKSYAESYQEDVVNQPVSSAPSNYVYGDKPVDSLEDFTPASGGTYSAQDTFDVRDNNEIEYSDTLNEDAEAEVADKSEYVINDPADEPSEVKSEPPAPSPKPARHSERIEIEPHDEEDKPSHGESINMFKLFGSASTPRGERRIEPDISRLTSRRTERSNADLFDDDNSEDDDNLSSLTRSSQPEELPKVRNLSEKRILKDSDDNNKDLVVDRERRIPEVRPVAETSAKKPSQASVQPVKEEPEQEEKPRHVWKKYIRPGLELLDDYPEHGNVNTGEIEDNKRTISETLARFKIECEVTNVTIGPAITRYDVIIEDKTKIKQSLNYKEAIAMALRKENVTAYLNYSKGALSIEVPNNSRTVVGLKSMLSSPKFINSKASSLTFALGKNVEGEVVCPDITKMPHLLVAGTTGSGKSICLSALLISLLYKYGPEELRLILVDPKQVEFISYDKLPHLMINEIIYDVDKAIKALNWAIKEMERRYTLFKDMTEKGTATKNLDEYNNHLQEGEEKLPKVVIILDEFGDLMLQAKKDIEGRIIKLVQKARAAGIHLVLATQRPSVDCITGLIKSNLPTRIGFKVNSFDDARTIFDIGGAEKLLGKGDLYFRSAESPELARIQGCFVDTHEVQKVTDFVKAHNETYFDQTVSDFINKVEEEETSSSMGGDDSPAEGVDAKIDDTYIKALYYCVTSNQASVSMIQRRFPVGYIKACKIIDWMENMNYVTQSEGSKPRKVLLSKDEFLNTYGEIDD